MKRNRILLAAAFVIALASAAIHHVRADAADEIKRLASAMEWKPGSVVADIGAGDGRWAFAAAHEVGATGKVFATELDPQKIAALKSEVGKRHLSNVIIVESKEADTNLSPECCDAIFLRRVYRSEE